MIIAVIKEKNRGCDYTIDCGTKIIDVDADTFDDALKEIVVHYGWDDDLSYEALKRLGNYSLTFMKVKESDIGTNFAGWLSNKLSETEDIGKIEEEKRELAELKRLERKYRHDRR